MRRLVVAALLHGADDRVDDLLGIALAHGPVDHPRLAEAAALGAAARDLDRHAIEDGFGPADRAVVGERKLVEVRDEVALHRKRQPRLERAIDDLDARVGIDRHFVERRHVDAAQLRERDEALATRNALRLQRRPEQRDLGRALFAVADHDGVEERASGSGCVAVGPARDDERVVFAARSAPQRDAAEVEHREHVRVRELELEREADDVEVGQRTRALERDERQLPRARAPAPCRSTARRRARRASAGRRSGSCRGS